MAQLELLPGELTPDVDTLYTNFVNELVEDPALPTIEQLIKMFKICPINRLCIEVKALRGLAGFGKYSHPDNTPALLASGVYTTLTEWVNSNFQSMQGNLDEAVGKMFRQTFAIGYSVAEIINSPNVVGHDGEWRLGKIKVLNPCRYSFAGTDGEWDRIIYKSHNKGHYPIPREKLLHVYIPSLDDPENPLGDAQGARAYQYYKARLHALRNWNRQMVRNSKGMHIIKGDSNDTDHAKDSQGNTIYVNNTPKKEYILKKAVQTFSQAGDGDTVGLDKRMDHVHLPGMSGTGTDYNLAITRYTDDIFLAYGIPKTLFQEGSAVLGQAGLNYGHRLLFDTQIEAMVQIMRNQLVEQVVKPLLQANFGIKAQSEFGNFHSEKFLPPEMASTRVSNLMTAMLQGIVAGDDLDAINIVRRDCGLESLTLQEFDRRQKVRIAMQQQQQQQQESYATDEELAQPEEDNKTDEESSEQ